MKQAFVASTLTACPENLSDSARVKTYLEKNNWQIVEKPDVADLLVLNTCALVSHSVEHSLAAVRQIRKESKSDSQLIVWGCLAMIDPEALRQVYDGPTFGEKYLNQLDQITNATVSIDEVVANDLGPRYHSSLGQDSVGKIIRGLPIRLVKQYYSHFETKLNLCRPNDPNIFYIKTSTGCLSRCAYCVVCKSRERIRSKSVDQIMGEFRDGLNRGYMEYSLIGTDLGPQGKDLDYTLADLLCEMVKVDGDYRIGLRNVHPGFLKGMLSDLEPALATRKIWYVGIPAESGSNRILKLMRRNHTIEDIKDSAEFIKRVSPNTTLRTQLMVGFPTETDEDFIKTLKLLDNGNFDFAEPYWFSARPGTAAQDMDGRVPDRVIRRRMEKLVTKVLTSATLGEVKRRFPRVISRR